MGKSDLTEDFFEKQLYTNGIPDPDLVVRTSGESRISNFLLWQIAYTEIHVTKRLWPEFDENDLINALKKKEIAGAALDVFCAEPPNEVEFLKLPNLMVTPHIGGNSVEAVEAMGKLKEFTDEVKAAEARRAELIPCIRPVHRVSAMP